MSRNSHNNSLVIVPPTFTPFTDEELAIMAEAQAKQDAEHAAWLLEDERREAAKERQREGWKKRKRGLEIVETQKAYLKCIEKRMEDEGCSDQEARETLGSFRDFLAANSKNNQASQGSLRF